LRRCAVVCGTRHFGHRLNAAGRSVARSFATASSQSADYRRLLVQAVHQCAIRFQEVAAAVVHTLMDFLGDSHYESAVDVITFVRYAGVGPATRRCKRRRHAS